MDKLVFIIDDDQVYLNFMKGHFNQMKEYRLEVYSGGDEAVEELKSKTPNFIIVDHHLSDPNKDGVYFLKLIKKVKPSVPLIYITANATEMVKNEALKAGARNVIVKSESFLVQLRTTIDEINSQKQSIFSKFFN